MATQTIEHKNLYHELHVRRFALLSLATLIVSIATGFFIFFVEIPHILQLRQDVKTEQAKSTLLNQKVQDLQTAYALETADNQRKVNLALPSQKPLLPLLAGVDISSQGSGAAVTQIEATPGKLLPLGPNGQPLPVASGSAALADTTLVPSKVNGVDTLHIIVTVKGTLTQVHAFIDRVETMTPFTDITEIKLSSLDFGTQNTGQFEAKLGLTAFYYTQAIQLTVDSALPVIGAKEQKFLQNIDSLSFSQSAQSQQNGISGGGLKDLFGVTK